MMWSRQVLQGLGSSALRRALSSSRVTGKVVSYNAMKGWGFLAEGKGKPSVFVHYSQVKKTGFKSLRGIFIFISSCFILDKSFHLLFSVGEDVEYEVHFDEQTRKSYAANVTGPGGAEVLGAQNPISNPIESRTERIDAETDLNSSFKRLSS